MKSLNVKLNRAPLGSIGANSTGCPASPVQHGRQPERDLGEEHHQQEADDLERDEGQTPAKISCSVTSSGATDLSQKQAGPKGGDRK